MTGHQPLTPKSALTRQATNLFRHSFGDSPSHPDMAGMTSVHFSLLVFAATAPCGRRSAKFFWELASGLAYSRVAWLAAFLPTTAEAWGAYPGVGVCHRRRRMPRHDCRQGNRVFPDGCHRARRTAGFVPDALGSGRPPGQDPWARAGCLEPPAGHQPCLNRVICSRGKTRPLQGRDESAQRGAPTCLRVSSVAALAFRFES